MEILCYVLLKWIKVFCRLLLIRLGDSGISDLNSHEIPLFLPSILLISSDNQVKIYPFTEYIKKFKKAGTFLRLSVS